MGLEQSTGRRRENQEEEERKECGHKTRRQTDNKQRGSDVCDAPVILQRVFGMEAATGAKMTTDQANEEKT